LAKVFKICQIGETKVDKAKMSNAKVTLVHIVDRVSNTYNTDERWVVLPILGNM
jgi:hypothetical protein